MIKRSFDAIVSLVTLLVIFPLLFLISIWIKVDSQGPILFKQLRVGRNLKNFKMYKFRTMLIEKTSLGEVALDGDLHKARENYQTTKINDPRITVCGNILRKYHLDELPQFFNVLRGEMSLVGPRPDVPAQEIDYTKNQWHRRHKVRPGISGLSQIFSSSKKFNHNLRIALDLKYQKANNICLDIYILFKTALSVLRGKSY